MMPLKIRVSVLIFKQNKLLVVGMKRKEKITYVLAGGSLEKNEDIFQAGIREVKEETNLDVIIDKIAYVKELYTDKDESIDIILLGKIVSGHLQVGCDPEYGDKQILNSVEWFELSELKNLNFHPKQLKERLPIDFENGFKEKLFLGRFEYPEVDE